MTLDLEDTDLTWYLYRETMYLESIRERILKLSQSAFKILENSFCLLWLDFTESLKRQFCNIKQISKAIWRKQSHPINGLLLIFSFINRNIIKLLNQVPIFLVYFCVWECGKSKSEGRVGCVNCSIKFMQFNDLNLQLSKILFHHVVNMKTINAIFSSSYFLVLNL